MTARALSRACRAAVAASMCALAVLASCRELAEVEEREACDGLPSVASDCDECSRASCCDAVVECQNQPLCAKLWGCLSDCESSEHCRAKCRGDHRAALGGAYAKLASCATAACGDVCGGYLYPSPDCATCGASKCGPESAACAASEACLGLTFCQRPCASWDHACKGKCEAEHSGGAVAARELSECLVTECTKDCGYEPGPDWSCLADQPKPLVPEELEMTFQVEVLTAPGGSGGPTQGITVRVCTTADCNIPFDEQGTKEHGWVTVKVPANFDGFLEFTGGGLMDFLHYPPLADGKSQDGKFLGWNEFGSVQPYSPKGYSPDGFKDVMNAVADVDPARGHVFLGAKDCARYGAAGSSFLVSPPQPQATPYYGQTGEMFDTFTSAKGNYAGGFLNLEPGEYEVKTIRRDTLECVAKRKVVVRANTETQIGMPLGTCNSQ